MKEFTIGGKPRLQKAFAEALGVPVSGGYSKAWKYLFAYRETLSDEDLDQSDDISDTHFTLPVQWDEAMSYARQFYGMEKEEKPPLPESWDELDMPSYNNGYVPHTAPAAFDAFSRLYDLRQAYWNAYDGWRPDWTDDNQFKYCIQYNREKPIIDINWILRKFLAFPTMEQAKHFLKHHKALIEQARELL